MNILVYGSKGWIGQQFIEILITKNIHYSCGKCRIDDEVELRKEIEEIQPTHIVSFIGRTHGRICDKIYTTIDYLEQEGKLAEKMIVYYGMGKKIIYPNLSEMYKEKIDNEVFNLINDAYAYAEFIVKNSKDLINESSQILKREKILTADTLIDLMRKDKYKNIFDLKYSQ